jgi:hypothetical protein
MRPLFDFKVRADPAARPGNNLRVGTKPSQTSQQLTTQSAGGAEKSKRGFCRRFAQMNADQKELPRLPTLPKIAEIETRNFHHGGTKKTSGDRLIGKESEPYHG